MEEQFIHVNEIFDNSLINRLSSKLILFNHSKIIFTEKLPSNIKKLSLDCREIEYIYGVFDDLEKLTMDYYLPEIIEALKTNIKLNTFGCRYYNFINIDGLPKSITKLKYYNRNYTGSLDRITSVLSDIYPDPTTIDINIFPNLKHFKFKINIEDDKSYQNDKIELIRFRTKKRFQLKLLVLQDLHLYIDLNNNESIEELNNSFVYLFENCLNINKLYIVLNSEQKIEECIVINTCIDDFNLKFLDWQINNLNVSINGFKNKYHKEWNNGYWKHQDSSRDRRHGIIYPPLQYINHDISFFINAKSPPLVQSVGRALRSIKHEPTVVTNSPTQFEPFEINLDLNGLISSIKFDTDYSILKPNSEEYILVLRMKQDIIPLKIMEKICDILLVRGQTIIVNKNDEIDYAGGSNLITSVRCDYRREYYLAVLNNLDRFPADIELRYFHHGLLTDDILKEFEFTKVHKPNHITSLLDLMEGMDAFSFTPVFYSDMMNSYKKIDF
jgi:hypothetical protein